MSPFNVDAHVVGIDKSGREPAGLPYIRIMSILPPYLLHVSWINEMFSALFFRIPVVMQLAIAKFRSTHVLKGAELNLHMYLKEH